MRRRSTSKNTVGLFWELGPDPCLRIRHIPRPTVATNFSIPSNPSSPLLAPPDLLLALLPCPLFFGIMNPLNPYRKIDETTCGYADSQKGAPSPTSTMSLTTTTTALAIPPSNPLILTRLYFRLVASLCSYCGGGGGGEGGGDFH